ncbi:hypothetical protein KZP23_14625 [Echinicola marina]|uniref:hypothetical protein n=1 Tax=Echinicola marina TaxID=2859768 RepID=UPI001CF716A0|nr:hypothetical protein [Echinicola marina]UCS91956.1 hypothetical protein KZP23_14625 [Echinicola marina]
MDKFEIQKRANSVEGLSGMTVNERLWASRLMNYFEKVRTENKEIAKVILQALRVDEKSINQILN